MLTGPQEAFSSLLSAPTHSCSLCVTSIGLGSGPASCSVGAAFSSGQGPSTTSSGSVFTSTFIGGTPASAWGQMGRSV